MPSVERAKVLAYRTVTNQLHERVDVDPGELGILDLGVPNVPAGTARQALAARTSRFAGPLAMVWSTRGARHLHRRADLPGLVAALWPISDADAAARFASNQIPDGGKLGIGAFRATAEAFAAVVSGPTSKGDASQWVSDRVPAALTYDCGPCQARHIAGSVFQQAGLAGGVQLDEDSATSTLLPIDDPPAVPEGAGDPSGLIRAYLRLLGPAAPADVAKYLGTTVTALKPAWPGGLAEVRVDGRRTWLPEESLAELLDAGPVRGVRLLPASDPFLQARDRGVLTPLKDREKDLWRALGNPGALLVDGDLAGSWRAKVTGKRLVVTVTAWTPLPAAVRAAIDEEAQWVAAARGIPTAEVTVGRGDT